MDERLEVTMLRASVQLEASKRMLTEQELHNLIDERASMIAGNFSEVELSALFDEICSHVIQVQTLNPKP